MPLVPAVRSLVCLAFVASLMLSAGNARAAGARWIVQGPDGVETVSVDARATLLEGPGDVLYIDYQHLALWQQERTGGPCARLDLGTEPDDPARSRLQELLATYEVVGEGRGEEDRDLRHLRVVRGGGLLRMRNVAPLRLGLAGRVFQEGALECWLAEPARPVPELQMMLAARQAGFARAPLLRLLDPLALVQVTGGVPRRMVERAGGQQREWVLLEGPDPLQGPLVPPPGCFAARGRGG